MKVRRVVAGVDENGEAVFLSDTPAPCHYDFTHLPGQGHARIWRVESEVTTERPAEEPTTDTGPFLPGPGGASFLILRVAPDSVVTDPRFDGAKAGGELATSLPDLAAVMEPDNPGMHRSNTVDYGVVLDGEVYLELKGGTGTSLSAGDTFVQLGAGHAWRNRTDRPATLAVVLTGVTK